MAAIRLLAEQFESNRRHLRNVAYRILGSRTEADDAVQEAWLRLTRSDAAELDNVTAWLTTVVARLCLDMLRARKARTERVCFVLHDLFNLPFDEIAPIVNRSSAAARQLASRARRRVQGAAHPDADLTHRREIVNAFLEASQQGTTRTALSLLTPQQPQR